MTTRLSGMGTTSLTDFKPIELTPEPWHLRRDGSGYVSVDGQWRLRSRGLGWMIEHDRNGQWETVKPVPNLKTAREFIQSNYRA